MILHSINCIYYWRVWLALIFPSLNHLLRHRLLNLTLLVPRRPQLGSKRSAETNDSYKFVDCSVSFSHLLHSCLIAINLGTFTVIILRHTPASRSRNSRLCGTTSIGRLGRCVIVIIFYFLLILISLFNHYLAVRRPEQIKEGRQVDYRYLELLLSWIGKVV